MGYTLLYIQREEEMRVIREVRAMRDIRGIICP